MRKVSRTAGLVAAAAVTIALAACGNGDAPKSEEAASAVGASGDTTTDLGLDASTSDAMSVDVAAGGIEPMADPMADPMANQTENTETPAEEPPSE
jgi:hypothetical protein